MTKLEFNVIILQNVGQTSLAHHPQLITTCNYASKNNVTQNDLKYKISEKSFIDVNCLHLYPQIKVTFGSF